MLPPLYWQTGIQGTYGHVKKGTRSDRMELKATVVFPYVKNVSESIQRILTRLNIRTCFRPVRTLRQFLVHPKDQLPMSRVSRVVYSIPCQDCDKTYIGETGRTLEHRVKEHKRAYTSANSLNSAVAEYSLEHGHSIKWGGAEVVSVIQRWYHRCFVESWHIRGNKYSMNRDRGFLPEIYNSLVH